MGTGEGLLYGEGHLTGAMLCGRGMQPTPDEKSHFLFPSHFLTGASHWSNLTQSQRTREPVDAVHTGQPARAQSWVEKGGQGLEGQMENIQNHWIAL